ncbi:MAG: hydroxyacid dehydrogenase [Anaerolineae bacterium]|nr:hydroxyacid dehydrogenase [Anaerolineae bacterium]
MTSKLVILNAILHRDAYALLFSAADVEVYESFDRGEVLDRLPQARAIILGGISMGSVEMEMGSRLEVIGRHGMGIDNVDLVAATERRLLVTHTPEGPTESTAEHTLMLILAAACRLSQFDRAVRRGSFRVQGSQSNMGYELRGKTLGVIGFGRIGRRVAQMCRDALDMSILVYDPYQSLTEIEAWGATPVTDLVEMAAQVDVLTAHVPLTEQTRHLINRDVIRAMKPSGILVNMARGPVLDESALIDALHDGLLAGVGLDVFDPEPPEPGNPLFDVERVVFTPHTGSFTYEGRRLMGVTVVQDVLDILRGERPRFMANPQVWDHRCNS